MIDFAGWVLTVHLLGAALWVGGIGFLLLILRPSMAILLPSVRLTLHAEVLGRFFGMVWVLAPLVMATGYLALFGFYGGFKGVGWPVHLMHLTGWMMVLLFVIIYFLPFRALRRAVASGNLPAGVAAMARLRMLASINLGLGVVTLAAAAFAA